jgi:hypothetical protein
MAEANEANRYHIPKGSTQTIEEGMRQAAQPTLEQWARDPNCIEMDLCVKELAERKAKREKRDAELQAAQADRLAQRRQRLEDNPFDPRTEVSADAIHIASRIVKHLWIIFVLLPVVAVAILIVAGVIK